MITLGNLGYFMADTISNRSDFNVEQLADVDANSVTRRNPGEEMDAERVRRAVRELEQVRDGLTEPERSQLSARIDSIQTQLASGVSPAQLLAVAVAYARTEAQGYTQAEAVKTQAAIYEGIALSAEAQARVNYRADALLRGDLSDYYLSTYDPDNRLNEGARAEARALIEADPELREGAAMAARAPEGAARRAEAEMEQQQEWLLQQINAENDPQKKEILERIKDLRLMRDGGDANAIHAAVESGDINALNAAYREAVHHRAEMAREKAERNPDLAAALRSNHALLGADGYSVDYDKVVDFYAENLDRITDAMNKKGRGERLTAEDVQLIAVGNAMHVINADHGQRTQQIQMLHQLAKDEPARFNEIFDSSIPEAERAQKLADILKANDARGTDAQILNDAKRYINQAERDPRLIEYIRSGDVSRYSEEIGNYRIERRLEGQGFTDEQIQKIQSIADQSPQFRSEVMRSFRNDASPEEISTQRNFINNVLNDGGPENREALSIMRYYNVGRTIEGLTLQANIYNGSISAGEALSEVQAIKHDIITRMQPYNVMVTQQSRPEYLERVQSIPGMTNSDGSLHIENLIELARHNRDALDSAGTNIGQRANVPWNELSEEQKDARAVARTAAMFKSVDLIRSFGADIVTSMDRPGATQSKQLSDDIALYEKITNTYGIVPEAEQRAAIDDFLKRDSYYASSAELRAELTDFVVQVTRDPRTHEMLTNTEFLKNRDGQLKPGDYGYREAGEQITPTQPQTIDGVPPSPDEASPTSAQPASTVQPSASPAPAEVVEVPATPVKLTAQEKKQLASEGAVDSRDAMFRTQLEDRIQDVIGRMDMKDVVAKFGQHLGQYNVGEQSNVTHHEIENALKAAGITDVKQMTDGKSTRVTDEQLVDALRNANFNKPASVIVSSEVLAPADGYQPQSTPTAQQDPTKTVAPAR